VSDGQTGAGAAQAGRVERPGADRRAAALVATPPAATFPCVDTHCHAHEDPDPASTWERARRAGVVALVCVGTDVDRSRDALAVAQALGPGVAATVGLHPHEASRSGAAGTEGLERLLAEALRGDDSPVVGVGECGLDYHYDLSPRPAQRAAFAAQVALATRFDRTLVIHTREAWDETFDVLRGEGVPARVIFHCFTGGPAELRRCLDLGGWVSFSGVLTFPSAGEVREAARACPQAALLTETDSPYLAPVPYRGRRNEPALVGVVTSSLAAVREEDPGVLAEVLLENAVRAFGGRLVPLERDAPPTASGGGPASGVGSPPGTSGQPA